MLRVDESEVTLSAIRAQGAGGQNVNKVSSAIHLRFSIAQSSLPDAVKARLLALQDARISSSGELIIKAQRHRTQELNRIDAMQRLHDIVASVEFAPKTRYATRPTRASKIRRLSAKSQRGETKALRGKFSAE